MNASSLGPYMRRHLELRRSLGFILRNAELALTEFDLYVGLHYPSAHTVTRAMVTGYLHTLTRNAPITLRDRVTHLRQFCRFLFQFDPETYIPGRDLLPPAHVTRRPHIYTEEEAKKLIRAALALPPSGALRPHTYATLLSLLWVSGMRIGEALKLNLGDFDAERSLLFIREGKFLKSRLIPLARSTAIGLTEYLARRAALGYDQRPEAPFFINERARRCTHDTVNDAFLVLSRNLDIKTLQGRDPRLHDFRHTFATRYLDRISREGKNPGAALPLLATYLGHVNIMNTQVYLHPSFSLLETAGQRFSEYVHSGGCNEGS